MISVQTHNAIFSRKQWSGTKRTNDALGLHSPETKHTFHGQELHWSGTKQHTIHGQELHSSWTKHTIHALTLHLSGTNTTTLAFGKDSRGMKHTIQALAYQKQNKM